MDLDSLIKRLQKALSKAEHDKNASRERIDALLEGLEKKEEKLKHKLEKATDPKKRKKLKLQIKIVSTQRKKGIAFRRKL